VLWQVLKKSMKKHCRMATEWCVWSGFPAHDRQTLSMLSWNRREKNTGRMSEIHIAVRRSLNSSQKQAIIRNYFFKITSVVLKKCKAVCEVLWMHQTKCFGLSVFFYCSRVFSPSLAWIIGSLLYPKILEVWDWKINIPVVIEKFFSVLFLKILDVAHV
jgi:hypothetical protein